MIRGELEDPRSKAFNVKNISRGLATAESLLTSGPLAVESSLAGNN